MTFNTMHYTDEEEPSPQLKFIVHCSFGSYPVTGSNREEAEKKFRGEYNYSGGLTLETETSFLANQKVTR